MNRGEITKLTGAKKSAILMLTLHEDTAAEVMQHMSSQEVERVSREMAGIEQISHADMQQVLDDFSMKTEELSMLGGKSREHLQSILTKVMGSERALSLMEDFNEVNNTHLGIDSLNLIESPLVMELLREEHPQIIATILVHLDREKAAEVLQCFDDKQRDDMMLRIATFSGVQPAALQTLTEVLTSKLRGQSLKRSNIGGIKTAAEILNFMNSSVEENVIEHMRAFNEDLVQKIIDEMFLFESLEKLEDHAIKLLLKEIDTNTLAVALKGAPEQLLTKFTSNMSERASQLLLEDMEARGPMRLSVVEIEQKNIVQIVRKMADAGQIVLSTVEENYV